MNDRPKVPTIRQRTNPSGKKVWIIDYVDPETGERKRETIGTRKEDAERRKDHLYDEMMVQWRGDGVLLQDDITIEDLLTEFFRHKERSLKPKSKVRYRIYEKNFLDFMKAAFPQVTFCRQIQKIYLEECLDHLAQSGQKNGTVNGQLRWFRTLFNFAVRERRLLTSPAQHISGRPDDRKARPNKAWSPEQVEQILQKLNPHWRQIHEFLYLTGMRQGELINLTWDAVKLDDRIPHISIQASDDWTPKDNEIRHIQLGGRGIEIVKSQSKHENHPYVFTGPMGRKINPNRIYDVLKEVLKELGFPGSTHWWRGTFTSRLAEKGHSAEALAKLLGHSTTEMTGRYTYFRDEHLQQIVHDLDPVTGD
ncbi:tyrosine-type recombinase/integrase [bacterium]|nr:tyrosine-type recombinase/integrase [bacterium]